MNDRANRTFKQNLYRILESGHADDIPSQVFDWTMMTTILISVAAVTLETVDEVAAVFGGRRCAGSRSSPLLPSHSRLRPACGSPTNISHHAATARSAPGCAT